MTVGDSRGTDGGLPAGTGAAALTGDLGVHLLGVLEVVDGAGGSLVLKGHKLRALMALLALDVGRVVPAERLVDDIYGERLPMKADNALQALVSGLRRSFRSARGDTPTIVTRANGYILDLPSDRVDACRFTALVAEGRASAQRGAMRDASGLLHDALTLWRGPALADFASDDFAVGARVRLEELHLSAIEDCITADLELGRHAEWVGELGHLAAANPLRERLWGLLMITQYRSGHQADALRTYQNARRELADELGIEPGPELRRLEAAVLAQDPSLGPPTTTAAVAHTGKLPSPLAACLGRDSELAAVADLLAAHRLVTLVGPGGTGKTRLAVEVGLRGGVVSADGAWMVDLASVSEPDGVVSALRTALGPYLPATGQAGAGDLAGLTAAIGQRELLVLLDNCEHVIGRAAEVAAQLVAACPQLRMLATSREGLGVPGEVMFPVGPLGREPAIELFVERATAANPSRQFGDASLSAVADICTRLDGLPLAIELAAASSRALDIAQIADRLSDRFRLLTLGPRTALPRQRTLRAVIDWSYDLLAPAERLLFDRLSVFPGGCALHALELVCAGEGIEQGDLANLVSRLVDQSLLTVQPTPNGHRYTLLQSLAEYAGERLAAGGQPDVERRKHAAWVLGLVRAAERGAGHLATVSLAELEAEMGNLDAALAWAGTVEPSIALELAGRMGWFWFWTGRIELGWSTLSACLDQGGTLPDDLRARATGWAGLLGTVMQARGASSLVDLSVLQARACGDPATVANVLAIRAALAILQGRVEPAHADLLEAAEGYGSSGDHHGCGMVAMLTGLVANRDGQLREAATSYEDSIRHFSLAGDHWAAGVPRQRLAELSERDDLDGPLVGTRSGHPAPAEVSVGFSQALIRAQLSSVRPCPPWASAAWSGAASGSSERGVTDAMAAAVARHIRGRVSLRKYLAVEARDHLHTALEVYRLLGCHAAASICLGDLGRAALVAGEPGAAMRCHTESTTAAIESGDRVIIVSALEAVAAVLGQSGHGGRAAWALGAADVLRDGGAQPWDTEVDDRARAETTAVALLGDEALGQLRDEGRTMGAEDVLARLGAAPSSR